RGGQRARGLELWQRALDLAAAGEEEARDLLLRRAADGEDLGERRPREEGVRVLEPVGQARSQDVVTKEHRRRLELTAGERGAGGRRARTPPGGRAGSATPRGRRSPG